MKKIISFILLGALAAATLAGCSEVAKQPAASSDSPLSSSVSTPSSEVSSVASEPDNVSTPPETKEITLKLDKKTYQGDFVGEFPRITGADTEAIRTINNEIQKLQDTFEAAESAADGEGPSWVECKSYSTSNEKYVNIVLNWNEYPTYGTQGKLYSYTYDIENDAIVYADDFMTEQNLTVGDLQSYLEEFLDQDEATQYRVVADFEVAGCRLNDDGTTELLLAALLDDGPETPNELVTTSSQELFVYSTATESISNFRQ